MNNLPDDIYLNFMGVTQGVSLIGLATCPRHLQISLLTKYTEGLYVYTYIRT